MNLLLLFSALAALRLASAAVTLSSFTGVDSWNSPLIRDPRHPWPRQRSGDKLVVITYCYDDQHTKNLLAPTLRKAIDIWYNALGGPAGKKSGHAIVFKEFKPEGPESPFCLRNGKLWDHNSGIPLDAVRVHANNLPQAVSTVGYINSDDTQVGGRHEMRLDPNTSEEGAWVFAHELGHIMGMLHEHQRYDRDNYVSFQCANVINYPETRSLFASEHPSEDPNLLCTDYDYAKRYGFDATGYIVADDNFKTDASPAFDMGSIMLYDSATFAQLRDSCNPGSTDYCVLLKYTNPAKDRLAYIDTNKVPSQGDVGFVKGFYPWMGPN